MYDVRINAGGLQRFKVVKAIRAATGATLKHSVQMLDAAPVLMGLDVSRERAELLVQSLRAAGADAEVVCTRQSPGLALVEAERLRQMGRWSSEHDAGHNNNELLRAAIAYMQSAHDRGDDFYQVSDELAQHVTPQCFPEGWQWKPGTKVETLIKALALGVAELDRLLRVQRETGA